MVYVLNLEHVETCSFRQCCNTDFIYFNERLVLIKILFRYTLFATHFSGRSQFTRLLNQKMQPIFFNRTFVNECFLIWVEQISCTLELVDFSEFDQIENTQRDTQNK